MLANPNAPSGLGIESARIRAFCEAFEGVVIVDEAYAEFITVSRDAEKDKYREQAAINAILAAEKLLEQERQAVPATSPGTNASPAELPTLADPNDSGNNL